MNSYIKEQKIDLIVVGPITERSDIISSMRARAFVMLLLLFFLANIFLQKFHSRGVYFAKEAVLLAIRPLMIGPERCTERFKQYKPPQGYKCAQNLY